MPFSWLSDVAQGLKRPLLLTPGNNQLFGAVHISQVRHPELQLTINRERLLETEGFEELKHFVQTGLFWLTVEYARRQAEDKEEERERASKEESSVASTLDNLTKVIADSEGVSPEVKLELSRIVSKAKEAAERREEEVISDVSMLRVLASAGTTIIIFGHQLRALVDELGRIHADLTRLKSRLPDPVREDYDRILDELAEWRNTVEDQARQIGLLMGADARRRRRRLVVRDVVGKVIRPLSNYVKRYDIEVINDVANEVRTPPMFEAELHAILINIFTNALKAVRSRPERRIQVEATQTERGVYIRMLDTGIGVPMDMRTEVFRPFVTTSMPDPILGVGTGLGLAVVRDLLEIYGGTATFIHPPSPWHTAIEVFLPREV
jgi:signal transduction histidine kinase